MNPRIYLAIVHHSRLGENTQIHGVLNADVVLTYEPAPLPSRVTVEAEADMTRYGGSRAGLLFTRITWPSVAESDTEQVCQIVNQDLSLAADGVQLSAFPDADLPRVSSFSSDHLLWGTRSHALHLREREPVEGLLVRARIQGLSLGNLIR